MLFVYGDESMDETKQRVCAVAGIIGTEDQWKALEQRWAWRTNGVPFHGNHCDSDRGDYANRPHWENKALYRDLTNLLANSGLAGYGHAIDLMAKKAVFPESDDLAYYTAFQRVVFAMVNFAQHAGDVAEMTSDRRLKSDPNAGSFTERLETTNRTGHRISPAKSHSSLQRITSGFRLPICWHGRR